MYKHIYINIKYNSLFFVSLPFPFHSSFVVCREQKCLFRSLLSIHLGHVFLFSVFDWSSSPCVLCCRCAREQATAHNQSMPTKGTVSWVSPIHSFHSGSLCIRSDQINLKYWGERRRGEMHFLKIQKFDRFRNIRQSKGFVSLFLCLLYHLRLLLLFGMSTRLRLRPENIHSLIERLIVNQTIDFHSFHRFVVLVVVVCPTTENPFVV